MTRFSTNDAASELSRHVAKLAELITPSAAFSVAIGLLQLVPVAYMLQTYDRVVGSRSAETLLWLTVILVFALLILESLEYLRMRLLEYAAEMFDLNLRERLFKASFTARLMRHPLGSGYAFSDLKTLKDFLVSPVSTSVLDLPTGLVFMMLIFLINPSMGAIALGGVLFQALLGFWNHGRSLPALREAQLASAEASQYAQSIARNAQVIDSMGMYEKVQSRWLSMQQRFLVLQAKAADTAAASQAATRMLGMVQGSLIMGAGAFISLGVFSAGPAAQIPPIDPSLLIIASILGGRALMPLSQLLLQWRMVAGAMQAFRRLNDLLTTAPERINSMPLPEPAGPLVVDQVTTGVPGLPHLILRGVSFSVRPGQVMAVVGPSGAGKSTLARVILGTWRINNGKVRLDGVDVHLWDKDQLGQYLGYLPQDVELFQGSLSDNIARFGQANSMLLEDAISIAQLDPIIKGLPLGLQTDVGDLGGILSGGQQQRVGLARAVYGNPKLVVLDEPNASMDTEGEKALRAAVAELKKRQAIVVLITHRRDMLDLADLILVLREGQVQGFGPRDQVLAAMQKAAEEARQRASARGPQATSTQLASTGQPTATENLTLASALPTDHPPIPPQSQ